MARVLGTPRLILTTSNGLLVNLDQALDTTQVYAETKDLDLGANDLEADLHALVIEIESVGEGFLTNLTVAVGYRDRLTEPLVFAPKKSVLNSKPIWFRDVPLSRYFRLRFEDAGVQQIWHINSIEFYGENVGIQI